MATYTTVIDPKTGTLMVVPLGGGSSDVPAHNDTTSKQGGSAGEYYHLTAAQYAAYIDKATAIAMSVALGGIL